MVFTSLGPRFELGWSREVVPVVFPMALVISGPECDMGREPCRSQPGLAPTRTSPDS